MVGSLPCCCARAVSGAASTDPPIKEINSRRLIAAPGPRTASYWRKQAPKRAESGNKHHFAGASQRYGRFIGCMTDRFDVREMREAGEVDWRGVISIST